MSKRELEKIAKEIKSIKAQLNKSAYTEESASWRPKNFDISIRNNSMHLVSKDALYDYALFSVEESEDSGSFLVSVEMSNDENPDQPIVSFYGTLENYGEFDSERDFARYLQKVLKKGKMPKELLDGKWDIV